MDFKKIVKPNIRKLNRIKDTFDDRFDYLRLDKNERLLSFNKIVFKKFISDIKDHDLSGYHELGNLYKLLASYLGVNVNEILLSAGSDLGIKSVYEACIDDGDHIICHSPSYAMYRVYANMFGAETTLVPVEEDWSLDFEKIYKSIKSTTKLVAIENPNGFIGTKPKKDDVHSLIKYLHNKNILLLIDEAYIYVHKKKSDYIELINQYNNVIIAQTFSKGHGLAGCRFGYIISNPKLIDYISRVRPMHEVGSLAAKAAMWIIDNPKLLSEMQVDISENKKYLLKSINDLKLIARDTHANFLMIYLPNEGKTKNIVQKLKENKILIRRPFDESFLKGWSRVAVGSRSDSEIFIKYLQKALQDV